MLTPNHWIAAAQYESIDARRIAYWTAGEGRPLLLVHGYPTSSWAWHRIWLALAASRRLIACDMPGFGLSDKPRSGYSIHGQADVQERLLSVLGIGDYEAVQLVRVALEPSEIVKEPAVRHRSFFSRWVAGLRVPRCMRL